jgi:hypothetical protein
MIPGERMKKITLMITVGFVLVLMLAGCGRNSSDWVNFKSDEDGSSHFYEKDKIKRDTQDHTVQVWARHIYSDKGRQKELQSRLSDGLSNTGYEKLSQKRVLYEIDCRKNNISVLAIIHYDSKGKVLFAAGDTAARKWFATEPRSTSGALQRELCSGFE